MYGENHRSPKDKIIIKTFINLGNQEKVYVALEGSPYGPLNPSQTVYGIENSLPFITSVAVKSYVMLYRSLHRLYGEEGYLIENLSEFITMFIDQDPVVIQMWRTIPRPFKSSIDEELALLIDKILIVDEPNSILNKHTLDGKAFFRIMNHHTRSFMNIAKSFAVAVGKHLEGVETLDVSPLYDLLQNPHDIVRETIFAEEIANKWRNKSLYQNILKVYNLAKRDQKDLIVIIGLLHVEHLKDLLTSYNDEIEVQILL